MQSQLASGVDLVLEVVVAFVYRYGLGDVDLMVEGVVVLEEMGVSTLIVIVIDLLDSWVDMANRA